MCSVGRTDFRLGLVVGAGFLLAGMGRAGLVNGDFEASGLAGWSSSGFTRDSGGRVDGALAFGAAPNYTTFKAAAGVGVSALGSSGSTSQQVAGFDGFSPSNGNIAIDPVSGGAMGFVSNFSNPVVSSPNFTEGTVLKQTFVVGAGDDHLSVSARYLSSEGRDTAADANGAVVGADFAGAALLASDGSVVSEFDFDAQTGSSAAFHLDNYSDDNSLGYGGFVSGTAWQRLSFDLTGHRGESLTLAFFATQTGDMDRESRLLVDAARVEAVPEPGGLLAIGLGALAAVRARMGR